MRPGSTSRRRGGAQAYAYAQAWVGAGSSAHSQQVLSTSSMSQAHGTLAGPRAPLVHLSGRHLRAPASPPSLGITGVVSLGDDIEILYKDGPPLLVELCAWPNSGAGNAPLVDSPLASDPRVHLDPTVHPDGRFDPPHKTAVIFDPFTKMPWEPFTHTALTEIAAIYQVEATLTEKGYTISELLQPERHHRGDRRHAGERFRGRSSYGPMVPASLPCQRTETRREIWRLRTL